MDIHRARFVPYPPSAINALAFSHTEPDEDGHDPESLRLAVGRANGDIEIWNPAGGMWLQEKIFRGGKDRSVEALVWTQEPDEQDNHGQKIPGRLRLFSIGYSSTVTEWDLTTGLPLRHSHVNYSDVWCISAQPRIEQRTKVGKNPTSSSHQKLVAGCADGTLVLLSTADNGLEFDRILSRSSAKKARVLTVAFKDRDTVLAGFADSTIRVYNLKDLRMTRTISLGSGPPGGPKDILVWKVKCLPNGDFVSGDSAGDIRFYDGKNYSQLQRISGHEADVLDLAISRDGSLVFSGGMDRRTSCYTWNGTSARSWRKVSHKRYHDHDVKAMATYDGEALSMLISGGIDTQPISVPIRELGKEFSRGLSTLPHCPPLASAPAARLVVSWWGSELRIWCVSQQHEALEKPKVVARLALQGDENISSATISENGRLVAASTASGIKLFQLVPSSTSSTGPKVRIRKLDMPPTPGSKLVRFTRDGRWLAAVTHIDEVLLARVLPPEDPDSHVRVLPQLFKLHRPARPATQLDRLDSPSGAYARSISHIDFAFDGSVLAVADLAGYIDTWVVEGHEDPTAPEVDVDDSRLSASDSDDVEDELDSLKGRLTMLGQRWIHNPSGHQIPKLDSTPLLISFQPPSTGVSRPQPNGNPAVHPTRHNPHPRSHDVPTTEQRLLVVSAHHRLYHFEVLAGRLSQWSRRNPPRNYPAQFQKVDDRAKGCLWDVSEQQQRLWLYGEKWLFMFDLAHDLPIAGVGTSNKRKRGSKAVNNGAGDAIPNAEATVIKMRKLNSGTSDEVRQPDWIDLNAVRALNPDENVDDDDDEALVDLRRGERKTHGTSHDETNMSTEVGILNDEDGASEGWWHTFKYRPILGIVPLSGDNQALEVVLVERPSWDLDLPPRFVGSHE